MANIQINDQVLVENKGPGKVEARHPGSDHGRPLYFYLVLLEDNTADWFSEFQVSNQLELPLERDDCEVYVQYEYEDRHGPWD